MPDVTKVGFLANANNPPSATILRSVETAAASLNVSLIHSDVHGAGDLGAAFQKLSHEHVGLVFVPPDPLFVTERQRIAALSIAGHLPRILASENL